MSPAWMPAASQGESQCIRSAIHSNAILGVAILRKLSLESLYFRPSDKACRLKDFLANLQKFALQLPV